MNGFTRYLKIVVAATVILILLSTGLSADQLAAQAEKIVPVQVGTESAAVAPLTATPMSISTPRESTIVGGQPATPGEWPWQAIVLPGPYLCGGTLIASNWVLTAAHCVYESEGQLFAPADITVVLGDHDRNRGEGTEQIRAVAEVIAHKDYNARNNDNDIALLRLANGATLNSAVSPVALLTSSDDDALTVPGNMATVTGWGTTAEGGNVSTVLMEVALPLVSNTTCNQSYRIITSNMICAGYAAGGKDSCQGDSGGPLVVPDGNGGWRLTGVVSFGFGCARANYYGVYTRVSRYVTWIQQQTAPDSNTPIPTAFPTVAPTMTPTPTNTNVSSTPPSTKTPDAGNPTSTPGTTPPTATVTPSVSPTVTPTPTMTPTDSPVLMALEPDAEINLSYATAGGGRIAIVVPASAVDEPLTLYFDAQDASSRQADRFQLAKRAFQLIVYRDSLALHDYTFRTPVEITVHYTAGEISGLREEDLTLLAYDYATNVWSSDGIALLDHDQEHRLLIVETTRPAIYALGTANAQIFLPFVRR